MKLYLSSYRIGAAGHELARLVRSTGNPRTALVMNALDEYGPRLPQQVEENRAALEELGLEAAELDLRDYFGRAEDLAAELEGFGAVWAVGGNSFVLRRAMRASGFDGVPVQRVREGELVYGGFSAGAVVATTTLAGIDIVDPPDTVPPGYDPEVVWEGLGLVESSIAPHYRSEHPESALIDTTVEWFEARGMPVLPLRDGEALLVDGDVTRVVGTASP